MTTQHSLTLGSLLLTQSAVDSEHGYAFDVMSAGTSFGVAETVQEIVASLLADGNLVRITRFGNRQVTFPVEITGPDLESLAHGEVALRRELGRANALTWQPPDALAVPTVFDVVTSTMAPVFDDIDELGRRRRFDVTLTCLPFARSANTVTVEALAPPGVASTVTINNADTTTSWSANAAGSPVGVTDSGAYVSASTFGTTLTIVLDISGTPFDLTGKPYVLLEMSGNTPTYFSVDTGAGAVGVKPLIARATDSGTVLYVLLVSGTALHTLSATRKSLGFLPSTITLNVHDVSATNTPPQVTPRQITRVIETGGTERTPGSIHVQTANGTDNLTQAIVHTCPEDGSGYSPPLRRWRTAGQAETTDAALYSGKYQSITGTGITCMTPTSALPEGGYILAARLKCTAIGTVNIAWSTSTVWPGGSVEEGFVSGVELVEFPDTDWHIVPLAILSLPSVRTKSGEIRTIVQAPVTGGATTHIDEAWLFRVGDDCALTVVDTDFAHLWLNSPGTDAPVPTVWVGDSDSVQVHPGTGLIAQGRHVLNPDGTAVFTAALSDNPETDATFFRRWHSNAAE